jgi:hypothetical protein
MPELLATTYYDATQAHIALDQASLDQCLYSIEETLTSLYKTSKVTKQSTRRDRFQTALMRTRPDEGGSEDEHSTRLGELFPRLRDPGLSGLRTRLSACCVARNRYLVYRERHKQAIATGGVGLRSGEKTAGDHNTGETDTQSTASTAEPTAMEEHSVALQDISSIDSGSTLSYRAQTGKDIRFKVLDLKSVSRGRNGFSCPYCHDEQVLDTSRPPYKQRKRWERHVFADLKTYVCLEEHCSSRMFESSHAWLRHQLSHHLKEWRCRACNVDLTLNSLQDLREHYYTQHSLMHEDDDFLQLAKASEVLPKTVSVDRCKFCKWSEFLPKGVDRVSTSRFRKHVGSHLEQIALATVPEKYRSVDEIEEHGGVEGYRIIGAPQRRHATGHPPAGLQKAKQRPSEFGIGDMVVKDVRDGGKITMGNFVIEDRRYLAASGEWMYRLKPLEGAVHARGLWYPEDLLEPK